MVAFDPTKPFSLEKEEEANASPVFDPTKPFSTESTTQESTTQEIAEGIASGLIAIPQGIAELGTGLTDLVFDTNYTQDVTDFADGVRAMAGIDPEGAAGEIAEVVTQFVIPGLGAAGAVSKLGRLKNASRLTKTAAQAGAAGITDAVVATDGITTLGDFFGGGVTQTTDTVGLEGREAAAAKIGNKLRVGLEAAGATAAVDPILRALGFGGRMASKVATPITAPAARIAKAATTSISSGVQKIADESPLVDGFLASFRFRGNLPQDLAEAQSKIRGEVDAELGQVSRTILQLESGINDALKNSENILANGSPLSREEALNRLYGYLTKDDGFVKAAEEAGLPPLKMLPKEMQSAARKARVQVDRLSKQIKASDYLTRDTENLTLRELDAMEAIDKNIGSYLRRRYKIFEDKSYASLNNPAFAQRRLETIDYFTANPRAALNIAEELGSPIASRVEAGRDTISRQDAEALTDDFLNRYSGRTLKKMGTKGSQEVALNRLRTGLFKSRQASNPVLRRLLGEIKDPIEALTTTVADMSEFVAIDKYYKYINDNLVDEAAGNFISKNSFDQLSDTAKLDYVPLEEGFGSLEGTVYAKRNVYKDLVMQTRGNTNDVGNVMRAAYSGFLKGKGITQYGATVLSPITQIRNFTSSSLFALAQGNVGAGANIFDSIGIVWNNIYRKPDKENYFRNLQRLGVVGNQSQLKEIDKLIREGYGLTAGAVDDTVGVPLNQRRTGSYVSTLANGNTGMFIRSINSKARDFYQGGDDVWKVYNFEFEKNKVLSALGSEAQVIEATGKSSDEYAADIVKNTVPNYERVPRVVKELRKLPVGNFIAFPAEILRTSANTLKQALDELANPNKKIQEIGMRRLTGFVTTTMVVPTAIQKMALDLTGTTQEQIDAVRETGPSWVQESILLPTSTKKNEDGKTVITGYVNYSYTNPYSYLNRPARAILNAVNKGEDLGSDTSAIATDAVLSAMTAMFEPFASESILTERVLDATVRGGVSQTGAKVYRKEVDTPGDIAYKSMAHISGAFVPGAAKLFADIKAQKKETQEPGIELGRLARAFAQDTKDPAGNERQIAGEIFRALSGITETEVKPENNLVFKGFEYDRSIQTANQIFNSAVSTRGTLSDENAIQTFINANEARYRVMNDMYRFIQNMRQNMTEQEVRRALKKRGVTELNALMRGEFVPFMPSSSVKKTVRENGNKLPMSELYEIKSQLQGRKLGEPETPQPEPVTQETTPSAPVAEPIQSATPQAGATASIVPPNTQAQSAPVQPRDPSLYSSGNPIDALKNLQIVRRLQGQ